MQLNSYAPWFRWCSAFLSWWSNSPGFPSVSQGGCSLVLWRRACSHAIREHLYNPSCFSGLPRKDNVCFVSVCVSLSGCTSQNLFGSVERWVQKWTTNNQSWGRGGDINLGIGNSGLNCSGICSQRAPQGKSCFS